MGGSQDTWRDNREELARYGRDPDPWGRDEDDDRVPLHPALADQLEGARRDVEENG